MKYLRVQELPSHLNVKVKTIYSWISLKEIPHLKLGRLVRFDKDEIDRWIEERKVDPIKPDQQANKILKKMMTPHIDIKSIVKNAIEKANHKPI
ncbi:MAG: helix-turn-helix domain-containing protein [Nitrospiria bacterium]